MQPIILVTIAFIALLMFPILLSVYWYYKSTDSVLFVRSSRTRDPRFFAKSFDKIFLKAWDERNNETLKMSHKEKYVIVNIGGRQNFNKQMLEKVIVVKDVELKPRRETTFLKEIYAWENAHITKGCTLRSIRCRKNMIIGENSIIERWADSDKTVAIYDNCDLGISVTAAKGLIMGHNCTFKRIYAPVIYLGLYPDNNLEPDYVRDPKIYSLEVIDDKKVQMRYITRDECDEDGYIRASVMGKKKIVIDEDIVIQGNINADDTLLLGEKAVVCGSIFAEYDVFLSKDSTVLGNIFTQGKVFCEEGVVIGRKDRIVSVVSRKGFSSKSKCIVYGYISSESGGIVDKINPKDSYYKEKDELKGEEYFIMPPNPEELTISTIEEFEAIDSSGFRKNTYYRKVVITAPIKEIRRSMFFDCYQLEEVVFPSSLEYIDEYAFAKCQKLKEVNLEHCLSLHTIDRCAFEMCSELKTLRLPNSIKNIGKSAFKDDFKLTDVHSSKFLEIKTIDKTSFAGCPVNVMKLYINY